MKGSICFWFQSSFTTTFTRIFFWSPENWQALWPWLSCIVPFTFVSKRKKHTRPWFEHQLWIKRSSLLHLPAHPHVMYRETTRACLVPRQGLILQRTPDLHPEMVLAVSPVPPHASPGAEFVIAWTMLITLPATAFLSVPLPAVATHSYLSTPKSLRGLREASSVHMMTLQEWVLTSNCACLKSTRREAEVQRWKRTADTRLHKRNCLLKGNIFFLIIEVMRAHCKNSGRSRDV